MNNVKYSTVIFEPDRVIAIVAKCACTDNIINVITSHEPCEFVTVNKCTSNIIVTQYESYVIAVVHSYYTYLTCCTRIPNVEIPNNA